MKPGRYHNCKDPCGADSCVGCADVYESLGSATKNRGGPKIVILWPLTQMGETPADLAAGAVPRVEVTA